MRKELESIKQRFVDGKPTLITLVGESGAGKSTLCKLINLPDIWYSSSGPIVKRLNQEGIPISHDSIHKYANNAYSENPIDYDKYERKREWLNSKIKKFERDLYQHAVTKDQLMKIKFLIKGEWRKQEV